MRVLILVFNPLYQISIEYVELQNKWNLKLLKGKY